MFILALYMGVPITIWSGFVHQGMVALIVALTRIEELDLLGKKLDDYYLELEGEEDFSILHNNARLEVHQVKAKMQSTKSSQYSDARKSLAAHPIGVGKFLHTSVEIEDWEDGSDSVVLYKYPDNRKCFGDKLPYFQRELLKKNHWVQAGANHEHGFYLANQNLSLEVCHTHFQGSKGSFRCAISLNTIRSWAIGSLPYEIAGNVWHEMRLGLNEFLEECYHESSIEDGQEKYIVNFVEDLGRMDEKQMRRFIRNVNPNVSFDQASMPEIGLFARANWRSGFLVMLNKIKAKQAEFSKHQVPFFRKHNAWWVPTMVTEGSEFQVLNGIRNNMAGASLIFFEATNLITRYINYEPESENDRIVGRFDGMQDWLEKDVWEKMGLLNRSGDGLLDTELKQIYSIERAAKILNDEEDN